MKASGCQLCRVKLTVLRESRVDLGWLGHAPPWLGSEHLRSGPEFSNGVTNNSPKLPGLPISFFACKEMRLNGILLEFP